MTKERLKVMTILDIMFIIAFGYSTIASWGVYESYYTITYFGEKSRVNAKKIK